jgi:hypothetical protein
MMIDGIEVAQVVLLKIEQRTHDEPSAIIEERITDDEKAKFSTIVELDGMSGGAPMLKSDHGGDWVINGGAGCDLMPYELLIEIEPGSRLYCEGKIRFGVRKRG